MSWLKLPVMSTKEIPSGRFPRLSLVAAKSCRAGSFEVTVNDTLVFSKLERKGFPDFNEIVDAVIAIEGGGSPKTIQKVQKSNCSIS
ncbi:migration and invasion enhancer 1-like isoform X3 [Portunus trituberculatus]|uniref:migration and invasion enhancer 1-like isoform X3 n=1 Tax=Portunus trituberculatus TaxID=210409 RepID=UPI001E1D0684|nr:migration and invasion enhancer 1-like isoform X3 [Portunus trituberculatus]